MKLTQDSSTPVREFAGIKQAIGNYELGKELGQGGWGTCYRAVAKVTKDTFVLRILASSYSQSELSSLQAAVRYTSGIESERIQRAIEVRVEPAGAILVSEFVPGVNLSQLLSRSGRLPIRQAIYCIARAIEGLDAAHKKSIFHGELRPSKIIVDGSGNVVIRDLALAQVSKMRRQLSGSNLVLTLPKSHIEYAAPEVLSGSGKPNSRSDLYSLGCILFFLLTGRPPYHKNKSQAIVKAHVEAAIPRLTRRVKGIPASVDECLAKMLAKQPGDRFATYKQCHEALRDIVKSLPKDDRSTQVQLGEIVDVAQSNVVPTWAESTTAVPRWLLYSAIGLGLTIAIVASVALMYRTGTTPSDTVDPDRVREIPTAESEDSFDLR